ncbi:hypothetical protein M8J76_011229 [Diaphorina citri]|nr:hypothetical protein M8J75_015076 [Diaphorina citri]KAI5745454.1 hypothetical protein M8J76_011229 [Diaphorina citri]
MRGSFSCFCSVKECGLRRICESRGLGCFSNLVNNSDVRTAQHGCLDLLSEEEQSQCQNIPGAGVSSKGQRSLLLCCQKNMCNLEPEHYLVLNQTSNADLPANYLYSNQHVWYRTATIAVPICGVLILGMLILVGAKILKSDNIDERILMSKLREKHEQCSSSLNSGSLNIVPLLPPRNPLQGIGVNINKLDHVVLNMNSGGRGLNAILPCGGNILPGRVINNSSDPLNPQSSGSHSLRGMISNSCTGTTSFPHALPISSLVDNATCRSMKNCNAVSSDIIKDLEILDKPSSSNIPPCNVYSGRPTQGCELSVNSQANVSDKINYKKSFISSWMSSERDVTTDT